MPPPPPSASIASAKSAIQSPLSPTSATVAPIYSNYTDPAFNRTATAISPTNTTTLAHESLDNFEVPRKPSLSAQDQLTLALEALRNNSKKLDAKLDKIEDLTISATTYYDTSANTNTHTHTHTHTHTKTPVALTDDDDEATAAASLVPAAAPPQENQQIKKKNDSFFNEFLSKSDNLIAQTQRKMERLSQLDSIAKPVAPPAPPSPAPKAKPKPTATILNKTPAPAPAPSPSPSPSPTPSLLANTSSSSKDSDPLAINSSKSLIDLKQSSENLSSATAASDVTTPLSAVKPQVDLLFDLDDQSFTLNTEPIVQTNSYFDLIGLSFPDMYTTNTGDVTSSSSSSNNQVESNVNVLRSLLDDVTPLDDDMTRAPVSGLGNLKKQILIKRRIIISANF